MRILTLSAIALLVAAPAVAEGGLADLVPTDLDYAYEPDLAKPGWVTAYYTLNITNAGDAPVTGIDFDWKRPGSIGTDGMRASKYLDVTLNPGESVPVESQFTALATFEAPAPVFCVHVDPDNAHAESDELNNLGCFEPVTGS